MNDHAGSGSAEHLRQRAEDELRRLSRVLDEPSPGDLARVVHELEVHQIELEMQNEELRLAQREIESARDAYLELYEFAPCGYLTFAERGLILGANLTFASMVGVTRSELIQSPFSHLIVEPGRDTFYRWCKRLFADREQTFCELRLSKADRPWFWVRLEAFVTLDDQGRNVARGIVIDITDRRRLEMLVDQISQAERDSVRHDLHDTVSQHLIGITFLADALSGDVVSDPGSAVESARTIQNLAATALEQTQQIARGLARLPDRPSALFDALNDLAASIREVFGTPCRVTTRTRVAFPDRETATQLYLIAREAALNAARHSEATRVTISLAERDGIVRLTIRDNGRGLGPSTGETTGMGLEIMNARASLIGASLTISPASTDGTVVECRWRRPEGGKDA